MSPQHVILHLHQLIVEEFLLAKEGFKRNCMNRICFTILPESRLRQVGFLALQLATDPTYLIIFQEIQILFLGQ